MECHSIGNNFVTTTARVVPSRTKRFLGIVGRLKCAAVVLHGRLVLDARCLWRPSSLLVKSWASGNQSNTLRSASFVNESREGHESWFQVMGPSVVGQMVHCIRPHDNRCTGSQMCAQAWQRCASSAGVELKRTKCRSRAFNHSSCHSCKATNSDSGVIRSCAD